MNLIQCALAALVTVLGAMAFPNAAPAASVYHVGPQGSDDDPGSRHAPLLTIGAAAGRATAGDLVVVAAGVYREAIVLTRSGTPAAPIILRGLSGAVISRPDPSASVSAFTVASSASYVTIQGFEVTGGFAESVFVRPGAHDIELAGLHVHHNQTGIWIAGASDVVVRDSVLDHNIRTGVRIFDGAHGVRIINSRAESNDDGEGCAGDSDGFNADPTTSDIAFERATAIGNSEDGFDLQGSNMALFQIVAQDNGCSGVKLAGGGYLENTLVERSRIGINVNAPAGYTTVLQNCTLSQNDIGLRAIGQGHTLLVRNSIIVGPGKSILFPDLVALREDHNLLSRPLPTDRLIVREDAGGDTTYSGNDVNNGHWQRDSGQGEGTLYGDPGMDPSTCRPRSGSAAIDSGVSTGYVPFDLVGTPRPAGNGIDRGAFEWMAAVPTLRLLRGMLHHDGTGTGSVHLTAEIYLPAGAVFDPQTDTAVIVLYGARGAVQRIEVAPGQWRHTPAGDGTRLRVRRTDRLGGSVRVALHLRAGYAALRVSARAADVWAADAAGLDLTADLGRLHVSTHEPIRQVGSTLYVLPCGGGGA